ncbi:hypothetical protein U1Q18_007751 [Sarracenia purpurea var. burkii]
MNTPMKIARVPTMRRETASTISLIGGLLFQGFVYAASRGNSEGDESSSYGRVEAVTDPLSFFLCNPTYFVNGGLPVSSFSSSAPPPSQLRDDGASG